MNPAFNFPDYRYELEELVTEIVEYDLRKDPSFHRVSKRIQVCVECGGACEDVICQKCVEKYQLS